MILLPLGHEQDTVRRLPVVTFGIMAICALVFLMTTYGTPPEDDAELHFERALEYFMEHPWLELDPRLGRMLSGGDEDLLAAELEVLREMVRPEPGTDRAAQQSELDRLTGDAFAATGRHPYRRWGLVPGSLSVHGLLTHMFLHGGWLHLIGNMLFLYLAGPFIEDRWGRGPFAAFYALSGFAAAGLHIAKFPGSDVPMIGASGAIAGVMGAFLVCYATTNIEFFYMVGIWVRGTFEAPAWLMLPLWFMQQLFFASLTSGLADGGGVGYWAHVGGFAFGAVAAGAARQSGFEQRVLAPAAAAALDADALVNPAIEAADSARAAGDDAGAFDLLARAARTDPGNLDTATALWDLAGTIGRDAEAVPFVLAAVDRSLRGGDRQSALRLWCETIRRNPRLSADPALLLRVADACEAADLPDWRLDAARRVLLLPPGHVRPLQLVRAASLVAPADPALATRALRAAVSRSDLHPDERATVEDALSSLATGGSAA